jgi:probable HAF family extracellular repeat protein
MAGRGRIAVATGIVLVGALALVPGAGPSAAHAELAAGELVDLGTVGGQHAKAHDVSAPHAEALTASPLIDIGTLGGDFSWADDVNDHGLAVGVAETSTPDQLHAVTFDVTSGVLTDIGTLGGRESGAEAVNDAGVVVGWSAFDPGDPSPVPLRRAFAYDSRTQVMTDLGSLGGRTSSAFDISDEGIVVGHATTAGGDEHAFAYDLGTGVMTDIGALASGSSVALAVNNAGQVVGQHEFSMFAYDLDTGVFTDFNGILENFSPRDVNDHGIVSGDQSTDGDARPHTYDLETGELHHIETPGPTGFGTAINNHGQVTVTSVDATFALHAWVVDPTDGSSTTISSESTIHEDVRGISETGWVSGVASVVDGVGSHGFVARVGVPPGAPGAPAAAASCDTVALSWAAPTAPGDPPFDEYVVWRDGDELAVLPSTVTTYSDPTAGPTAHIYGIAARSDVGAGPPTETPSEPPEACGLVAPPASPQAVPPDLTG